MQISDHKGMKLEINNKEKNWKKCKHVEVKQHARILLFFERHSYLGLQNVLEANNY